MELHAVEESGYPVVAFNTGYPDRNENMKEADYWNQVQLEIFSLPC